MKSWELGRSNSQPPSSIRITPTPPCSICYRSSTMGISPASTLPDWAYLPIACIDRGAQNTVPGNPNARSLRRFDQEHQIMARLCRGASMNVGGMSGFFEDPWKQCFRWRRAGAGPRRRETTTFPVSIRCARSRIRGCCQFGTHAAFGVVRHLGANDPHCDPAGDQHSHPGATHRYTIPMQHRRFDRDDLYLRRSSPLE